VRTSQMNKIAQFAPVFVHLTGAGGKILFEKLGKDKNLSDDEKLYVIITMDLHYKTSYSHNYFCTAVSYSGCYF
jgi:hypothetical protein